MFRRTFMQLVGGSIAVDDEPINTDTDRHQLPTRSRSRSWVEQQLGDAFDLTAVDWWWMDEEYQLPIAESIAEQAARVLNGLIDAPYRLDEYDCNGMSFQLYSLLARVGIDAGVVTNSDHMWVVMVTVSGSVVHWEPQTAQNVTESSHERYVMNGGLLIY